MPIVRSNDPRANDKAHQIKTVLGKMCDSEISIETKRACVQKLTELLQGMPMSESTFTEFGIQARLIKEKDETMLHVHVPKEYVAFGIEENREDQWIVFHINRALNTDNLGNSDSAVITDMQGNPIKPDESAANALIP